MKWLAAALVGVFVLSACDSDESEPEAPATAENTATVIATAIATQTAAPTLPATCPGDAGLCDFALELQQHMWAADFSWLTGFTHAQPFTCPAPGGTGLGGPFPLCVGAAEGEVRHGVPVRRLQSDGGTVEDGVIPALRHAILDGGHGLGPFLEAPRIAGIHCPGTPGSPHCTERAVVFFEGAAHIAVRLVDGAWRVAALQFGNTAEDQSVLTAGGELPFADESLERGVYLPWQPPGEPPAEVRERWLFAPGAFSGLSVEPGSGRCPAELVLLVFPQPGPFAPGKEPVPFVRIFPGVVGRNIGSTARNGFVEVKPTGPIDGEMRLTIPPEACQAGPLTLVFAGDQWRVAGYRVVP